jgi:hypothetical protein
VHCSNRLPLQWLRPSGSERARPSSAFQPEVEPGKAFSPIGTGGLLTKSGRPAASGRRWSGRGASRQGGGPDWWPQREEGLTERLLYGGGDRQREGIRVAQERWCGGGGRKGGASWWGAPFMTARGGGRWRHGGWNGGREMAAAKPWAWARQWLPLSEGGRRGLGASVRTGSPTGGTHAVFDFSNLSKTGSTLKNQNGCLILLKKIPIFACG